MASRSTALALTHAFVLSPGEMDRVWFVFGKLNNLHEKRVNLKRRFASVLTDLVNFIVFSRRLKLRQADVNFTQNILITSHFCYLASKLRAISTVKCVQISRGEFKILVVSFSSFKLTVAVLSQTIWKNSRLFVCALRIHLKNFFGTERAQFRSANSIPWFSV